MARRGASSALSAAALSRRQTVSPLPCPLCQQRPARYPNDHMCPEGQALAFKVYQHYMTRFPYGKANTPMEQLHSLLGRPNGVPS